MQWAEKSFHMWTVPCDLCPGMLIQLHVCANRETVNTRLHWATWGGWLPSNIFEREYVLVHMHAHTALYDMRVWVITCKTRCVPGRGYAESWTTTVHCCVSPCRDRRAEAELREGGWTCKNERNSAGMLVGCCVGALTKWWLEKKDVCAQSRYSEPENFSVHKLKYHCNYSRLKFIINWYKIEPVVLIIAFPWLELTGNSFFDHGYRSFFWHLGSSTVRTGCLSILMFLAPLAEVTP